MKEVRSWKVRGWHDGWTVTGDLAVFALPWATPGFLPQGCLLVQDGCQSPAIVPISPGSREEGEKKGTPLLLRGGFPEVPRDT